MYVSDIFILPNKKSKAIVLHRSDDQVNEQGISARLIIWDGRNDSNHLYLKCWQDGEAVRLEVCGNGYLIREQADGIIQIDELNQQGVVLDTYTYPPGQDWYHVLERGLIRLDFPGFKQFAEHAVVWG